MCEIVVHADVGGVLVAPRLLTCKELRGERATYTASRKPNRRVLTQSREQREGRRSIWHTVGFNPFSTARICATFRIAIGAADGTKGAEAEPDDTEVVPPFSISIST